MAEDAYLDALEALTEGDRERAIELATALVKAEPDHASAWALLSDAYIPGDQKVQLRHGEGHRSNTLCRQA